MDFKTWIIENAVTLIPYILGGGSFVAFFTERRKRKSTDKEAEANALTTMQNVYDRFAKDAEERHEKISSELNSVKDELQRFRISFEELTLVNNTLKRTNLALEEEKRILEEALEVCKNFKKGPNE